MEKSPRHFRHTLFAKLVFTVGVTLVLSISAYSYFVIHHQEKQVMEDLVREADRLSNTVRLGAHYAMTLNSRDDIRHIIQNISLQKEIENIRIYNKSGQITFTNDPAEQGKVTNIKAEACFVCHQSEPALVSLELNARTRVFKSADGLRRLGIMSPIYNEPSCATDECHVHPEDKKVLGALDLVISLQETDRKIANYVRRTIGLSLLVLLLTSAAVFVFVTAFVKRPMGKMLAGTKAIAQGDYSYTVSVRQDDEMGELADAFNRMGTEIGRQQAELNRQRDEYQQLFEEVPCFITVQGRDFKLLTFNREFADKFSPVPNDYCFQAYKGRDEKCESCPVETTFMTGKPTYSEQSGINQDGSRNHWLVHTSPIRDAGGNVVAAMEMSIDISQRRNLERQLEKSEQKYHAIFNNIPNPVFVLDAESYRIIDVNDSVPAVYGWTREEAVLMNFRELFRNPEEVDDAGGWCAAPFINQVRQKRKNGRNIFVEIRISPSEYNGQHVLLVTTSDITKRLEVEHQLNQAGKLATLGEMATGVAHELNQPLSVIKTVSSFIIKKIGKKEPIDEETLQTILQKVDDNVDRASKIITHMRLFARKSDVTLVPVEMNQVLERAIEIFNQQLKVRGIEVVRDFQPDLPMVTADPDRLEQVFINLLINARDAIERVSAMSPEGIMEKRITLSTFAKDGKVVASVRDTGEGIAEENLDKIFDPFFTTKEVGEGTGLGLSISYGIIKDCSGEIRAKSAPGEGACFSVEFPVRKES